MTRNQLINALREEIVDWGDTPPEFVTVPAPFLRDVLRLLESGKACSSADLPGRLYDLAKRGMFVNYQERELIKQAARRIQELEARA